MDLFVREKTLKQLQPKIEWLSKELERFRKLEHIGDIRQCGFMVGIELVRNRKTKERYQPNEKIGIMVIEEARKRGVIIRPLGDVIVLMPPLSINTEELNELLKVVFESIGIVTED